MYLCLSLSFFAAARDEADETGGANIWIMKPTGEGCTNKDVI